MTDHRTQYHMRDYPGDLNYNKEKRIKELEADNSRLRENIETLAIDYLNNCPDAYMRFVHKVIDENDE